MQPIWRIGWPSSLLDLELQVSPNVHAGVEGEADRRHPTERVGRVLVGNTGWCKRGPVVAPEEGVAQPRGGPENPGLVECEGEELTQDHTDSPGKMAERTGACQREGHGPGIAPSRIVLVGNTGLCRRGPVSAPGEGVVQLRGGPENPRAGGV